MVRRSNIHFILAILCGLFIVNPILGWIGIPTFDKLLNIIFGESNNFNKPLEIIISGILIFLIILGVSKLNKRYK